MGNENSTAVRIQRTELRKGTHATWAARTAVRRQRTELRYSVTIRIAIKV